MTTFTTRANDRWDLIASDLWQLPELGWAIAEANPDIADSLVLSAGISLALPELRSLRRPLTAANPARDDDGEFQRLPAQAPSPVVPPSGGGGSVVFPITIAQGGTGGVTAQEALQNLGAVALASVGAVGGIAGLDGSGKVSVANLPPFQAPLAFPIAVNQGGTGASTAAAARANLGAISLSDVPASIPPSEIGVTIAPLISGLVPVSNLPAYPTLVSLGAVSTTTFNNAIVLKLDASARNAANGVAGLDANSVIITNQIPLSVQFQLLARTGALALDLNTFAANHAGIRWLDGSATNVNTPSGINSGSVIQFDALFVSATSLYKHQMFLSASNRIFDRSQNNGNWGTWNERAYLNLSQTFAAVQDFTAGSRFRGGTIPPVTTTLTQAGVDANGNPRYWLINASASAGNRLKSITIAANGNIQFRHHADDGTEGNVLEHTASGNVLTNGTVRCGSGTSHFTGASFVPGALYFRSDISMLVYSDGTNWRRMDTNAIV